MQEEETSFTKKGVKRKRTQHECDVCEKMFGSPKDLARRMRIHTNEKPNECDVCEKRFRHSGNLKITCVFTGTRNRTSAMFARSVFVILVI